MSGREIEVRVVPHKAGWAAKLVGGRGSKPIIAASRDKLVVTAASVARKYQVPLAVYDEDMRLEYRKSWKQLISGGSDLT
jgi:hypothetical protein